MGLMCTLDRTECRIDQLCVLYNISIRFKRKTKKDWCDTRKLYRKEAKIEKPGVHGETKKLVLA